MVRHCSGGFGGDGGGTAGAEPSARIWPWSRNHCACARVRLTIRLPLAMTTFTPPMLLAFSSRTSKSWVVVAIVSAPSLVVVGDGVFANRWRFREDQSVPGHNNP